MVFSYNQSWTFKISLISQIVSFDADARVGFKNSIESAILNLSLFSSI